jgi:hypothetical protein
VCPLPAAQANHYVAPDGCGDETNSSISTSEQTGFTLASPGDIFSIGAIYDAGGSDNDYFAFQVDETGSTVSDLQVSIYYGCSFTGTGTPGSYAPIVQVRDTTDTSLGEIIGADDYDTIANTLNFGLGSGNVQLGGAAGTNTYHLWVDDDVGSGWCMDYQLVVELLDNTRPLACIGSPLNANLVTTSESFCSSTGTTTVSFSFNGDYTLSESDLSLVLTSGTGSGAIVGGSLTGGPVDYSVQITGFAPGDTYELQVASGTDSCGTNFAGGTVFLEALTDPCQSAACPLPAGLTNHHTAVDACGQATNQDIGTSEPTGFTLANVGDGFSVEGIYDSSASGSDNDYFAFAINASGTNDYVVRLRAAYGCNFTGTGTPGGYAPEYQIRNNNDTSLGSVDGQDDYDVINGSGNYGFGLGSITIPASELPAGATTLHLWLDDYVGSNWCMDYMIYVELEAIQ